MAPAAFTGSIAAGVLTVSGVTSGQIATGMILGGNSVPTSVTGAVIVTGNTLTGTGGAGTYPINNQTLTIGAQPFTGGGNFFAFGPYPDSAYPVQGTYYQQAPMLSITVPTNWIVTNYPFCLHAACMVEVAKFVLDDEMLSKWASLYKPRLQSLIDSDKAERWAGATMQIETA